MYREKIPSWIKRFDFLVLDIVALEISFIAAYLIRHGFDDLNVPAVYANVVIALMILSVIECIFFQSYSNILKRNQYEEFWCVFKRITYITVLLIVYLYLTKNADTYSRIVYVMTWEIAIIVTFLFRNIWKKVVNNILDDRDKKPTSFIVITTADRVNKVIESVSGNDGASGNYVISGIAVIDKDMKGQKVQNINVIANSEDVEDYLCRNWVDEVLIYLEEKEKDLEVQLIEDCSTMGITVHKFLAKELRSTKDGVKFVQTIGDYSVLTYSVKIITVRQMVIKRAMDILGGLVGMIATVLIFIFVAPAIFIKSPGPVIFKQWRVGRNGKKFQIYKFRSMYLDAEERKKELMAKNKIKDGMMFKLENDPRIIGGENGKGIGNFIRNTSLDEFPQFFNVLKGDMSLVGTRPPTLDEWGKYKFHHRKRMAIKPGLTGLWQVSGRSDITDFEEVVKLDTEYINNCSVAYDIKILLKTIKVVLFRSGSY